MSTSYQGRVLRCFHASIVWHTWSASQRSVRRSGRRCRPPPCAASQSTGTRQSSASLEQAGHVDKWSLVSLYNKSAHSIHDTRSVSCYDNLQGYDAVGWAQEWHLPCNNSAPLIWQVSLRDLDLPELTPWTIIRLLVKVLCHTPHKIGHFGDVPQANHLDWYGKTKPNTTKAHIHQSKEMYYNTK